VAIITHIFCFFTASYLLHT